MDAHATLGADQQVLLLEAREVLRFEGDLRPDRDHEFDPELGELGDHRRVRPELVLEPVVAHLWPVEEVGDDDVQRQAAALVLARDLEELLLVPVAELALPVAEAVLGHHRRVPGGVGVGGARVGLEWNRR